MEGGTLKEKNTYVTRWDNPLPRSHWKWGGVETTSFASKHVEKNWGGIEPIVFTRQNEWCGGWTHCVHASKRVVWGLNPPVCMEMHRKRVGWCWNHPVHVEWGRKGVGWVEPIPLLSKHMEKKWGGVEPPCSCRNHSKCVENDAEKVQTLPTMAWIDFLVRNII